MGNISVTVKTTWPTVHQLWHISRLNFVTSCDFHVSQDTEMADDICDIVGPSAAEFRRCRQPAPAATLAKITEASAAAIFAARCCASDSN